MRLAPLAPAKSRHSEGAARMSRLAIFNDLPYNYPTLRYAQSDNGLE